MRLNKNCDIFFETVLKRPLMKILEVLYEKQIRTKFCTYRSKKLMFQKKQKMDQISNVRISNSIKFILLVSQSASTVLAFAFPLKDTMKFKNFAGNCQEDELSKDDFYYNGSFRVF